ncbi:Dolichyl-diphosphooligosaccharide--protein glycosyltransferase subunit 1 [Erysiphe neolycopersici]|uniref:Dolichyl-diphosphooligosaccharide--protein glycosyltransferase subunit 1 n=1 Tax=Erysiphe neolycopersici TaxID=212602 RepID=A0A420HUS3_9PEZI|nr:Dolichyl-diphosphooligosaccharide--protein glycosyltransferase subunit 1 [Erysiphe neolycopersici]
MKSVLAVVAFFSFCCRAKYVEQNISNITVSNQIILPGTFTPPPTFKNTKLVRIINLEKNFPRETLNIVVENVDNATQNEYFLSFTSEQMKTVGALEVRDRNEIDEDPLELQAVRVGNEEETQYYRIKLSKPLPSRSRINLWISFSYLSSLIPKPKAIPQSGNQFLEYKFSAVAFSPYPTLNQKTDVKFPNSNIPEYTIIPKSDGRAESPSKAGSKFIYGPFSNTLARAFMPVKVRYQFTKPLIHMSKLERDIEISHWGGNVAFEERYSLINRAANLSQLFSRVEWASSAYYNPPTTAIKEIKIPLKVGSLSPYYIDIIGNVSTSRFRSNKHEANLDIKPRYPIFGGWKYPFRIGWDADSKKYLRKLETRDGYVLNVPFLEGPKKAEGVEYKSVEVRIILPEGAKNIKYSTTVPLISANISLHKTFMDTIGRSTLTLTAKNIFDDQRDRELIITYDYSLIASLRKPLVLFSGFFSLFVGAWLTGSLDIGIRAKAV